MCLTTDRQHPGVGEEKLGGKTRRSRGYYREDSRQKEEKDKKKVSEKPEKVSKKRKGGLEQKVVYKK